MDRVGAQKFIEAHRGKLSDTSRFPPFNDSDPRDVLLRAQTPAGRRRKVSS